LHNLVYTLRNSHGTKIVPTSFELKKFVVIELYVDVDVHLTTWIPSHNIVIIKSIPPNLGSNPLEPTWGATITFVQCIIPNSRTYMKLFNYHE